MATATISVSKDGRYTFQKRDTLVDANPRFKVGLITAPATTTSADTVAVDIHQNFGMTKFMGIKGWQHPTTDQVIQLESADGSESTTAMQNNTLTITVNGTSAAQKRVYAIYGI